MWPVRACLLVLAAALAGLRLLTFDEPFERDITIYAVIAEEMLAGRPLYAELFDHKPPAIYWTYALVQSVLGMGPLAVYALGVAAGIATLFGVYAVASAVSRSRRAGLLAAACWVVVSGDLWHQGNQPNSEVFINACSIWILAVLLRRDGPLDVRGAAICGVLAAAAFLYKTIAVFLALPIVVHQLHPHWRAQRSAGARAVATTVAAATVVIGAVVGWFAIQGSLGALWELTVAFNRAYAGDLFTNLATALEYRRVFRPVLRGHVDPLVALAVVALLFGRRRLAPPGAALIAASVGTFLAISLPGRFFPHYYQLWLPLLCVAAPLGLATIVRQFGSAHGRLFVATGGLLVVVLAALQLPSWRLPPEEWSYRKYESVFIDCFAVGNELDALLAPDESVYNWGEESCLYFAAGRRPPAGVLHPSRHLAEWAGADAWTVRLVGELEANPPELVAVSDELPDPHRFRTWLERHYRARRILTDQRTFEFWVRRNGSLEARLDDARGRRE